MTIKLVIGLAVVVVIVLVVVIIAARHMRAEDPDEFSEEPGGRGPARRGHDDRGRDWQDFRHPGQPARRAEGSGVPAYAGRPGDVARRAGGRAAAGYPDGGGARGPGRGPRPADRNGAFETAAARGYNGRRGQPRSGDTARRHADGAARRVADDSLPPVRSRRPGGRSSDSSEWDSSEWEKLSDVDYWAELASQKPMTSDLPPAKPKRPARPAQPARSPDQPAEAAQPTRALSRQELPPIPVGSARRDAESSLPVRGSQQAPALADSTELVPAPVPSARSRRPADDDPLTSPSFPKIPAADSRSYRRSRAAGQAPGTAAGYNTVSQQFPAAPTQQFPGYGQAAGPRGAVGNGSSADAERTSPHARRPVPAPDQARYSDPGGRAPGTPSGPAAGGSASPIPPPSALSASAAAGNPYGSYVAAPAPGQQQPGGWDRPESFPGYPAHRDASGYLNGRGGYLNGHDGGPAQLPPDHGRHAGGVGQPDYRPDGYPEGYPAGYQDPAYQAGPGYQAAEQDPARYRRLSDPYQAEGQARSGYGLPER